MEHFVTYVTPLSVLKVKHFVTYITPLLFLKMEHFVTYITPFSVLKVEHFVTYITPLSVLKVKHFVTYITPLSVLKVKHFVTYITPLTLESETFCYIYHASLLKVHGTTSVTTGSIFVPFRNRPAEVIKRQKCCDFQNSFTNRFECVNSLCRSSASSLFAVLPR